jgi:hypothetical protein
MVRQSSIGVFEADSVRWVTPYERTSHEAPLPASILYQSSGRVQDANLQDLLRGWYMCANRRQSGIVPGLEGKAGYLCLGEPDQNRLPGYAIRLVQQMDREKHLEMDREKHLEQIAKTFPQD